jgi:RNA polymerase sigma factor (sigma-70 family)
MLHLDFQANQVGLDKGESLNHLGLHFDQQTFSSTCDLVSSDDKSKPLKLDFQVEKRLFNGMYSSGLSVLLIFADNPVLLEALKNIILDIEDELHKYHAHDNNCSSASDLDLFGAIDALEMLTYLGENHLILSKKNRLKRRLSEWSPPTYLIINKLNKFLASPSISLVEDSLVLKLKKANTLYTHYRNRVVQANLRLVYSVANKFRYLALAYEDLVQEGNLGLIKAVERFDFSKGFRFSTYAHIVISQSIHLAIDKQGSLVRLPFKALREQAIVEQTRQKLEQSLGRAPCIKELENHLPDELEYKSRHISNAVVPNASSPQIYTIPGDSELLEQASPEEQDVKTSSLHHADIIASAFERLSEREAYIIRMRFGVGLSKEFTLEEISQTIGLSRERVRQLAHQAIAKLSRNFRRDCS